MRDSQRSKVYTAESILGRGRVFANIGEVQRYVDKLVGSDWWRDRGWGRRPITVIERAAHARRSVAFYDSRRIEMSTRMLDEATVLHELAHIVTMENGHGPAFVASFMLLVRKRMGLDAYRTLRVSFRMSRVRMRTRKKRVLTEEQKEVLRARVALAREARKKKREEAAQ